MFPPVLRRDCDRSAVIKRRLRAVPQAKTAQNRNASRSAWTRAAGRVIVLRSRDNVQDRAHGKRRVTRIAAALVVALAMVAIEPRAEAQPADDAYKGKQIRWVVGTAAGQDYD